MNTSVFAGTCTDLTPSLSLTRQKGVLHDIILFLLALFLLRMKVNFIKDKSCRFVVFS